MLQRAQRLPRPNRRNEFIGVKSNEGGLPDSEEGRRKKLADTGETNKGTSPFSAFHFMFTPISLTRLSQVAPELISRIANLAGQLSALDIPIQITQGLRSWSAQDALYAQGRSKPGPIVTDVPGGYSLHCFGLAVDVVPEDIDPGQPDWDTSHPAWQKIISLAPTVKLASGSAWRTFPDWPHLYPVECPAEPTDEMRQTFQAAGMEAVWEMFSFS
jgi:hypothetical protein